VCLLDFGDVLLELLLGVLVLVFAPFPVGARPVVLVGDELEGLEDFDVVVSFVPPEVFGVCDDDHVGGELDQTLEAVGQNLVDLLVALIVFGLTFEAVAEAAGNAVVESGQVAFALSRVDRVLLSHLDQLVHHVCELVQQEQLHLVFLLGLVLELATRKFLGELLEQDVVEVDVLQLLEVEPRAAVVL